MKRAKLIPVVNDRLEEKGRAMVREQAKNVFDVGVGGGEEKGKRSP